MSNNNQSQSFSRTQDKECCPEFKVEKWDKKTIIWNNKKFIKDTIPEFFDISFPPMISKKLPECGNRLNKLRQVRRIRKMF